MEQFEKLLNILKKDPKFLEERQRDNPELSALKNDSDNIALPNIKFPFKAEKYVPYAEPHMVGILGNHPQNLSSGEMHNKLNDYYKQQLNLITKKYKPINKEQAQDVAALASRKVQEDIANAYATDVGKIKNLNEADSFFRQKAGLDSEDTTNFYNTSKPVVTKRGPAGGEYDQDSGQINIYGINEPTVLGKLRHEIEHKRANEIENYNPHMDEQINKINPKAGLFDVLEQMKTTGHFKPTNYNSPLMPDNVKPEPEYLMKPFYDIKKDLSHIQPVIPNENITRDKLEQPKEDTTPLTEEELRSLLNVPEENFSPDVLAKPSPNFSKIFNQIEEEKQKKKLLKTIKTPENKEGFIGGFPEAPEPN